MILQLALALIASYNSELQPRDQADLVLIHGKIYTANASDQKVDAIAVRRGHIVAVGSDNSIKKWIGSATKTIDLKGAAVVPGFTDSHCHLAAVGEREMTLNLEGTSSLAELLSRIKETVNHTAPGKWITGRGWIETHWSPPVFPTAQDLDIVAPNNPVYLSRADGHGVVVNSAALRIAKITRSTPNPFGGEISKDPTGEPNGMLLDNAHGLINHYIPASTSSEMDQAVLLGVKRSLSLGWCEIQDAGGDLDEVARYRRLYEQGKIKLRIYKAVHGPSPSASSLMKTGASTGEFNGRFTFRTIKVVFDGALGSRGAALLEPYADTKSSGFLTTSETALKPMLLEALRQGVQVETHAIGDRANRRILDLYEEAFATVPPSMRKTKEPRWRVEHAQILALADIPRFAKLGVIPSMQPSHAIGDLYFAPARIGLERLAGAYAWQSLIKSGSIIAAGTDAPVERGEPMIEFYAAVSRKSLDGYSGDGWHLEQAVSRNHALKMLTLWPAIAAFEEKDKGTIEVGKLADFTVLSDDIMTIPTAKILKTHCLMTIIGGEVVYTADKN